MLGQRQCVEYTHEDREMYDNELRHNDVHAARRRHGDVPVCLRNSVLRNQGMHNGRQVI